MEAFKCDFIIEFETGEPRFFSSKVWAPTGWEAAKKVEKYILSTYSGVKHTHLKRWHVLNPFKFHFMNK